MGKKTQKRIILPVLDTLAEAYKDKKALEGLEEIIEYEQMKVLGELVNNTLKHEDRWVAYVQGFNASEIGKFTGYTRSNITYRITMQVEGKREEIDEKHRENRKQLFAARDWYLFVYLSDKEGDFRQMKKYLPESLQDDTYMYNKYRDNGGKMIEKDFVDRRHKLEDDKVQTIKEGLKEKSLEQVAFQERVYPENIKRLIKKYGWDYFTEDETGETEYTEKLNRWLESKRKFNLQASRQRSEERRKKKKAKEKEGKKEEGR